MILLSVEEAELEFYDALFYYASLDPALGRRFKNDVEHCGRRVLNNPGHFRIRERGYLRINLETFPYYLAFVVRGNTLWLLAVAPSRRKPHYWISRRKTLPPLEA